MDTLQNDIDDLEAEKADLKQRLQALAKRNVLEDLGMRPTGFAGPSPGKSAEIAAMLKKPSSPAGAGEYGSIQFLVPLRNQDFIV